MEPPASFGPYYASEVGAIDGAVERALHEGSNPRLLEAMRHYPLAKGKRLRPFTAMTVARAIGGEVISAQARPYAVALELIHNFTLVHDDIMDGDLVRKGLPAVHAKWDEATAINAGDALHARAFELIADLQIPEQGLRTLVRETAAMVRQIGEGQQFDVEFERRRDVTEAEYLHMIEYKTALMYKMAARGGTIIGGGSDKQIEALTSWGNTLGVGFQIRDDVLNLTADPTKFQKEIGADVRGAKQTIIAIAARDRMDVGQQASFDRAFGNAKATPSQIHDAIAVLQQCGAIEYAQQKARKCVADAHALLSVVPEGPHKEHLHHLVRLFVERTH